MTTVQMEYQEWMKPGRRNAEIRRPELGPFIPIIHEGFKADRHMPHMPRKHGHTTKRVFCRPATNAALLMVKSFARLKLQA